MQYLFALFAVAGASVASRPSTGCPYVPPQPPIPPANSIVSRWPIVTAVEAGVATITWGMQPSYTGPASVQYGGPGYERQANATLSALSWYNWNDTPLIKAMSQYRATLTGLPLDLDICYRLVVEGKVTGQFSFHSAPAEKTDTISFMAWGDFGVGREEQPWFSATEPEAQVARALWSRYNTSDFLVGVGDITYFSGKPHEYDQRTFPYYYEQWANKALFVTPGNHDYGYDNANTYLTNFYQRQNAAAASHKGRYYSSDWGQLHLVTVDTEWWSYDAVDASSKMLAWLDQDLAATKAEWTIVFMHKMPYTQGMIADTNVTTYLVPLFEKHKVSLVVGGHWHDYQRFPPVKGGQPTTVQQGGVVYLITGGGGYAVSGSPEFYYDEDTHEKVVFPGGRDPRHARLVPDTAPQPAVYEARYHFTYFTIDNACELRWEAIDINLQVFDSYTLTKC